MAGSPATRVTDQFAHSSAMSGVLTGLAIGIAAGVFIVATGGLGAIAVGAAIGVAGGAGLAGQAIGSTIMGPPTGAIMTGSPTVMTNRLPQGAVAIATGPCSKESGVPQAVATGAATVLVNNMPAARKGETMTCSATIVSGSPDVLIGGASVQVLPIEPEVPVWLSNTMLAMTLGGGAIAFGGMVVAYGGVVATGAFGGGLVGGHFGGIGGQMAAQSMGFGATGQAIGGVLGGFAGGALGGGAGFRGGQIGQARIPAGQPGSIFQPKKVGQTEPGAVPNNSRLQAEMNGAALARGRSAEGYPDLPPDIAKTFGDDVRPWNGDQHSGPVRRVIGQSESANGGFWQSNIPGDEAGWRGGSAVKNDWNGNGAYVESPSQGLRGWVGSARPQTSSDGINVLPGGGEQIWIPPGSASPGYPKPTPWSGP